MRSIPISFAVLLLAVAPANAATVSATTGGSGAYGVPAGTVKFTAAPGEANRVTMRILPDTNGVVEVREDAAALMTGDRCTLVSVGVAQCDTAATWVEAMVDLGDGDDSIKIADPIFANVAAGPGDDRVNGACIAAGEDGADHLTGCGNTMPAYGHRFLGGPGNDVIEGGPAANTIDGGGGTDVLRGGGGNDYIDDGDGTTPGAAPDVIEGAGGSDTVVYARRATAVHVDLSRSDVPQGAIGETDVVREVENAYGSDHNDVLIGNDDANRLDGGPGRDTLDGRAGDDQLLGGAGVDKITGGDGGDFIVARDVYRDSISCGAGSDTLLSDRGDAIARGCESITKDYRLVSFTRLGVKNRRVSYRVRCLETDELSRTTAREFEPCRLKTALLFRVNGRMTRAASGTCTMQKCTTLVLSRDAWRTLVRRRSVTAQVEFTRVPSAGSLRHLDKVTVKVHD